MNARVHEQFLADTLPALDLVYNLARRMLRRAEDVEDLVQETYLRAFEAWVRGRRPRRVEPWIATICMNAGRSFLRRASSRHEVLGEVEETRDPGEVDDQALDQLRREAVHAALWKLGEEQRVAIALMDLDGLTAAEVSRVTGWPRGTVLSRVHRGRKRLAELVDRKVGLHEEA